MNDINGKSAIVTGGSRGIGFAIADRLTSEGVNTMIGARNEDDLREAAQKLDDNDGNAAFTVADVRNREDCENMVRNTVEEFGDVDVLINNAGVGEFSPVSEMSDEQWNRVIDTNLTGCFYMTRASLPELKKGDDTSHIIFLSSLAGKNAFQKGAVYCASKFGLNGFAKSLMLEVRHDGIKVASIAPGSVHTEFSPEDKSDWALHPEDIADTVSHILYERGNALSSYVEMRPSQPPK